MINRGTTLIAVTIVLTAFVAGCGGSDESSEPSAEEIAALERAGFEDCVKKANVDDVAGVMTGAQSADQIKISVGMEAPDGNCFVYVADLAMAQIYVEGFYDGAGRAYYGQMDPISIVDVPPETEWNAITNQNGKLTLIE